MFIGLYLGIKTKTKQNKKKKRKTISWLCTMSIQIMERSNHRNKYKDQ